MRRQRRMASLFCRMMKPAAVRYDRFREKREGRAGGAARAGGVGGLAILGGFGFWGGGVLWG